MVPEFGVHLAPQFLPLQIITDVRAISVNAVLLLRVHTYGGVCTYTQVISGHTDDTSQHPGMMSAVFAAKSKFILCDACVVGPPSSILQQATNLTKGL